MNRRCKDALYMILTLLWAFGGVATSWFWLQLRYHNALALLWLLGLPFLCNLETLETKFKEWWEEIQWLRQRPPH